jgi:hypothetical protein
MVGFTGLLACRCKGFIRAEIAKHTHYNTYPYGYHHQQGNMCFFHFASVNRTFEGAKVVVL